MIVYVESNFLLEVVALQEEHEECLELLRLSREETIRLVLPAFSLAEPIHTIHRRHSEREELQQRLNREIALLSRSASFEERLGEVADVASILDDSRREEQERLDQLLGEAAEIAEIIPLGEQVLKRARHVRVEHRLSHPDAIVLASVLFHLESPSDEKKCFLQRDRKDFLSPEIVSQLEALDCRLLSSFEAGVGFVGAEG